MKIIDNLKNLEKFLETDFSEFSCEGTFEIEATALPRNASLIIDFNDSGKISVMLAAREEIEDEADPTILH